MSLSHCLTHYPGHCCCCLSSLACTLALMRQARDSKSGFKFLWPATWLQACLYCDRQKPVKVVSNLRAWGGSSFGQLLIVTRVFVDLSPLRYSRLRAYCPLTSGHYWISGQSATFVRGGLCAPTFCLRNTGPVYCLRGVNMAQQEDSTGINSSTTAMDGSETWPSSAIEIPAKIFLHINLYPGESDAMMPNSANVLQPKLVFN